VDRDEMLSTLRSRLLDGVVERVGDVLRDLNDDDLRALLKATDGDDAVAQSLAERFVFRKAAEKSMKRARVEAVARAAAKRDANAAPADDPPTQDAPPAPNEVKWPQS